MQDGKAVVIKLNDLINNPKLSGLLGAESQPCAIQLWVLTAKNNKPLARITYGRVVPYSFASDTWYFSDNNEFKKIGNESYKITCLNLYTTAKKVEEFLQLLCEGEKIDEINKKLSLDANPKFNADFANLTLTPGKLVFQPPEYLLNKASYDKGLTSPLENAGAISAAIIQTDKLDWFLHEPDNSSFYDYHVTELNKATGLDFNSKDKVRLGNIELLSFPSLDDSERQLLSVNIDRNAGAAKVSLGCKDEPLKQVQFVLKLYNLNKLICSAIKLAELTPDNTYVASFSLDDITLEVYDAAEVEVYHGEQGQFQLYDRWLMSFIREISFNAHVLGVQQQPASFDWLEKTVNQNQTSRAAAALTPINTARDKNTINGRKLDTWVALNSEFVKKTNQLFPQASNGKFFLRWGQSAGEGRLQFVEWFKKLFKDYPQHHLAIFDPYFDLAGMAMLNLYGVSTSEYSVFTTKKEDAEKQDRFTNLLKACSKSQNSISKLNLKIYAMPETALHDRYILIVDKSGTAVQGFHLSNSLQTVAENHPLLITPIPQDVLLNVVSYMQSLISDKTTLAFDMKQQTCLQPKIKEKHNEPNPITPDEFQHWLDTLTEESDFAKEWQEVATQLASTSNVSDILQNTTSTAVFIKKLEEYFEKALKVEYKENELNAQIITPGFYAYKLNDLLHLHLHQVGFERYSKGTLLTWADYYTIKVLWEFSPNKLLDLVVSAGKAVIPDKLDAQNIKKYALLNQALSNIYLQVELMPSLQLAQQLLVTESDVLQWMGLQIVKKELLETDSTSSYTHLLAHFTPEKKAKVLASLLVEAKAQDSQEAFKQLRTELFLLLPKQLNDSTLQNLVNSLRGHMHSLVWNGEWVYEDILTPLLGNEAIKVEQIAQLWFAELKELLPLSKESKSKLFNTDKEGVLLNRTAFILTFTNEEMQAQLVKTIEQTLKKQQRIVRQPLAQTSNWSLWDDAIHTAKWLECFVLLMLYYQEQNKREPNQVLADLLAQLGTITALRTLEEWNSYRNELIEFYNSVCKITAAC